MKTPADKPANRPALRRVLDFLKRKKRNEYVNTGASADEVHRVECRGPRPTRTEREDKCTIIASLNYCRRADVGWKHDAGELADWLMVPYDFAGNPCQRIGFRIHAERGPRPERTEIDEEAVP